MKNLSYLNKYRIDLFGDGNVGDDYNGAFGVVIYNQYYKVIASNGAGWEHVSISHKDFVPSWRIMCIVKDMFFEEEEVVMQLHPKKSEYINMHPRCLHLWKPIGKDIPTPPSYLVGFK